METNIESFTQVSQQMSSKINTFESSQFLISPTSKNLYRVFETLNDERCVGKRNDKTMNTIKKILLIIVKVKLNFNDPVLCVRTILRHKQHCITFARGSQKMKKIVMKAAPRMDYVELFSEIQNPTNRHHVDDKKGGIVLRSKMTST